MVALIGVSSYFLKNWRLTLREKYLQGYLHQNSNPMGEKESNEFSWTGLFLVTSGCFFLFSLFLKWIENREPGIFLWTGVICLVLGLISGSNELLKGQSRRRADF